MPYPYYPYYPAYQSYNTAKSMEWVSGKVGADAYQMPQGLAPETPIALWDSTDKKIFLKSWNSMGAPNPLQELEYEIKERPNPVALPAVSGDTNYVTKEDFTHLKEDIERLRQELKNMNNNNNRGGGNR